MKNILITFACLLAIGLLFQIYNCEILEGSELELSDEKMNGIAIFMGAPALATLLGIASSYAWNSLAPILATILGSSISYFLFSELASIPPDPGHMSPMLHIGAIMISILSYAIPFIIVAICAFILTLSRSKEANQSG